MTLRDLALDTLAGPMETYFSPGARARAEGLQARLRSADAFFTSRLKVGPSFHLAILTEADWAAVSPMPYGFSFVSDTPHVVVLPAAPERAIVAEIYRAARPGLPSEAAQTLARLGISYDEAVAQVSDFIAFHELGHVYVEEVGFRDAARWLEEILATYVAYSFLQAREPDAIATWNALSAAIVGHIQPASRSLDDFNRLYTALGPETYGWFQSHFNLRVAAVVEQRREASWLAELQTAGFLRNTRSVPTSQLLTRLDRLVPVFSVWAVTLARTP